MSRLDSSISQILGTDGDGRRKAFIDYISQQPAVVRAGMLLPDDATDPVNKSRMTALQKLGVGFPDAPNSQQIDPEIMLRDSNPLAVMQQRQIDGRTRVEAEGMTVAISVADDPNAPIPRGAIIVTTDFSTPNTDLVTTVKAFKFPYQHIDPNDPNGVGTSYWPEPNIDTFPELTVYYEGVKKYQKLSVIFDGSGGVGRPVWVRTK